MSCRGITLYSMQQSFQHICYQERFYGMLLLSRLADNDYRMNSDCLDYF